MGSNYYNVPVALRLKGELDVESLRRTLTEVVRRHESLRTSFEIIQGQPVQVIGEPQPFNLNLIDLTSLDEHSQEQQAREVVEREAARGFDLSRGPLLRATLVKLSDDEHISVLVMH